MAVDSTGGTIYFDLGQLVLSGISGGRGVGSVVDQAKRLGVWNDPDSLQIIITALENETFSGVPRIVTRNTAARDDQLQKVNAQLSALEEQGIVPTDDFAGPSGPVRYSNTPVGPDQTSPVFSNPLGTLGILLGVGGMSDAEKELREAARNASKKVAAAIKRGRKKSPVARRVPPLPKSTVEKAIDSAIKVLNKVPKSMLPDSDVILVGKTIGKAIKGGFGPLIAQIGGEFAIKKISKVLETRQFEKMIKILGPQDAAAVEARKALEKGPSTRRSSSGTKAIQKSIDPPRPRPPSPGVGNAAVTAPKPAISTTAPPLAQETKIEPAPKPPVPFATPAQIATPRSVTTAQKIAKAIRNIGQLSQIYGLVNNRQSGKVSSLLANIKSSETRTVSSTSFLTSPGSARVGTSSGCYTVCRKKNTGTRKRRKPRVCVTTAKARAAGLIT